MSPIGCFFFFFFPHEEFSLTIVALTYGTMYGTPADEYLLPVMRYLR